MSEERLNKSSNDEIDLLDLFRRMGRTISRWMNAIGRAILISIVFLVRNWLFLFLSIVLGTGVALLIRQSSKPVYTSDMVLKINIQPTSEMITYLNRLHTFCIEQNKNGLADALSLNADQVNRIDDISAYWIIDKGNDSIPDLVDYSSSHNIYDTINVRMKDRLDIRVSAEKAEELSSIRDGIIKYINNNKLFAERNDLRLQQTREMITRISFDINELDSLQKIKYYEEAKNIVPRTGGQMIFLQEQKTQLLYGDIHSLFRRKQKLEEVANIYNNIVTIISDFTIPAFRSNGIMHYIIINVPIFFGLTLIILIIKSNRKKLVDIYHKY